MGARDRSPLLARLVAAFRPELEDAAEAALDELDAALGAERVERIRTGTQRIRTANDALERVLDVLEARRDQAGTNSRRARR